MYKKTEYELELIDFYHPFGGKMSADNRWIKMARLIPWETLEEKYAAQFKALGRRAKKVRMAIGAILIQQKFHYTDIETVTQIIENPYLQYFIGLSEYQEKQPFDSTMMVYFRKRVTPEILEEVNKALIGLDKSKTRKKKDDDNGGTPKNKGKLIVDATCTPADIKYPTDLNLLNEAREKLEKMICQVYQGGVRPRTYCRQARRDYLRAAKNKKLSDNKRRQAIRKQLNYVARDLRILDKADLKELNKKTSEQLGVIRKLFEQQKEMFDLNTNSVKERIVSISQPHVRPIVRGKAGAGTEFGAKLSISVVNGFAWVDKISWENFNEGSYLKQQIEEYRAKYGFYPAAVIGDKIYCTRENRAFCKERGIRMSGPALGRPTNDPVERAKSKRQEKLDTGVRNAVEGVFGTTKRKFSLDLIMTRLRETSETVIRLNFTLLNLERRLRLLLRHFFIIKLGWQNLWFWPVFRFL